MAMAVVEGDAGGFRNRVGTLPASRNAVGDLSAEARHLSSTRIHRDLLLKPNRWSSTARVSLPRKSSARDGVAGQHLRRRSDATSVFATGYPNKSLDSRTGRPLSIGALPDP